MIFETRKEDGYMTYYPLAEGKTGKALFALALFIMLMLCRNSMYTFTILPFTVAQLSMYAVVGLLGIGFLIRNRKRWRELLTDRRMVLVLLVTAVILIPMLVKQDFQTMNFNILVCVYVAIFFSFFISCERLAKYYVWIMSFFAAYSLVACYLLAPLVNKGVFQVPEVNFEDWRIFHNFVFAFPRIKNKYLRNFGLFREPGVFQFFLNLALFCNNFLMKWDNTRMKWILNAILVVTVVSTFSTAGFVVLLVLAAAVFFQEKLYKNKRIMLTVGAVGVLGVAALVVVLLNNPVLLRSMKEMVLKLFVPNRSSTARYTAVFADLQAFVQSPIVGSDIAQVLNLVPNNTSSTLLLYAVYGVAGGSLHAAGWLALAWNKERRVWINLLLFAALMMSFNTQNLTTDVFFWLLPTMALVEWSLPRMKRKG